MTRQKFHHLWNRRNLKYQWSQYLGYMSELPIQYLELGVFEGYTLNWVICNLLKHPDSCATGVDPWTQDCMEPPRFDAKEIRGRAYANLDKYTGDKLTLIEEEAVVFLASDWKFHHKPQYDLIFLDTVHAPLDVMCESGLCWRLLKTEGVMIWDGAKNDTRRAVDRFLACVRHEDVWRSSRQIAARKGTGG